MKNPSAEYYLFDISIYAYSSLYLVLLHLFNLKPLVLAAAEKAAPSHLDLGVQFLARGQISEALQQLHSAIEENPNDFMSHYRRATAYLALGKGKAALDDLDTVLTLRPDFQAARTQRVSILTKYGRFDDALTELGKIKEGGGKAGSEEEIMPKMNELTKLKGAAADAQELMEHDEDYEGALNLLNALIESCPWNSEFRKLRSEALIATGDLSQAVFDLKQLTKLINDNTEGFLKLSLLYYRMADDEQSLAEIRECLKLDPDHKACFSHYKKVKKLNKQLNEAQDLINESKFAECIPKLNSALKTEPDLEAFKQKVAPKKCKCMSKSNQAKAAIKVCTEGLESLPDDEEMLVDRAEAYLAEEEYDKAIQDYETALKNNEESRRLNDGLKRAKKLLKQSQKRDYYKILGLKRTATKQEINKAYRKLAQQYHPDRYEGGDKEDAEKKFMDIAAAKEVLSDPEKRQQFDNGEDPLDPEEQSRQGGQGHPFGHGGFPFNFQGGNFQFKFKF